jgi:hypothetical protein
LPIPGRATIFYTPYPTLMPPEFALTMGMAMWGLLAPVAVWLVVGSEVEEIS